MSKRKLVIISILIVFSCYSIMIKRQAVLSKKQMQYGVAQNMDQTVTSEASILEVEQLNDSNDSSFITISNISNQSSCDISDSPSVTIIGDSVALGARETLLCTIPNSYVDAKINRALHQGYNIFKDLKQSGRLGDYVVISLGTNDIPAYATYINKFIDELPKGHRLIFVTPYDGHWNSSKDSYKTMQYLRSIKDKYSFVTIADWAQNVSNNPSALCPDKVHISGKQAGIDLFVSTVTSAIQVSSTKNVK